MSEANDWSLLRGVAEKPEPLHELRSAQARSVSRTAMSGITGSTE